MAFKKALMCISVQDTFVHGGIVKGYTSPHIMRDPPRERWDEGSCMLAPFLLFSLWRGSGGRGGCWVLSVAGGRGEGTEAVRWRVRGVVFPVTLAVHILLAWLF